MPEGIGYPDPNNPGRMMPNPPAAGAAPMPPPGDMPPPADPMAADAAPTPEEAADMEMQQMTEDRATILAMLPQEGVDDTSPISVKLIDKAVDSVNKLAQKVDPGSPEIEWSPDPDEKGRAPKKLDIIPGDIGYVLMKAYLISMDVGMKSGVLGADGEIPPKMMLNPKEHFASDTGMRKVAAVFDMIAANDELVEQLRAPIEQAGAPPPPMPEDMPEDRMLDATEEEAMMMM